MRSASRNAGGRGAGWNAARLAALLLAVLCIARGPAAHASEGEQNLPPDREPVDMLDRGRGLIGDRLIDLIDGIDRFFGDDNYTGTTNESFLRISPGLRLRDRGSVAALKLRVRANLQLPRTEHRLALVLSGRTSPDDPQDDTLSEEEGIDAALRAVLFDDLKNKIRLSTGARFLPRPDPFVRLRLQRREPLGRLAIVPSLTGFWELEDGFGVRPRLDFNYGVGPRALVRLRGEGKYGESTAGVEFGTSLSYIFSFRPGSAWVLRAGMSGETRPDTGIVQVRAIARYRWSMLYPWLFFELEPGLRFNRSAEFDPSFEGWARVEVVFGYLGRFGRFGSAWPPAPPTETPD